MVAEAVSIIVGPSESQIEGTYRFKQRADDVPQQGDTHVLIYVPVFVPVKSNSEPLVPKVEVNGHSIPERQWNDISLADDPSILDPQDDISKKFYLKAYQYAVPLDLIDETFSVSISYRQANLPGHVAVYLPIKPPVTPDSASVVVKSQKGYSLKPFTDRNFWNRSYSQLSFTPRDREAIRVKCVKARRSLN